MVLDKDVDKLMRLYAVGAKKDVFDACEMIDEIAKSAPLDGIRFIQIHKTGNDKMERAAFLEMNEYKRALLDEMNRRTSLLLVGGMAITFVILGAKIGGVIEKIIS